MFRLLDVAMTTETVCQLFDSNKTSDNISYNRPYPYVICVILQHKHGKLINNSDCPILAL